MNDRQPGKLVLADGARFAGELTGAGELPVCGEVVFNTSMTGYQEVVTDPSYAGQIVVMTCPQIGNYGVHARDNERDACAARSLVVRELSDFFSPAPGRTSLESFMTERGMPGLTGVDTRAVTLRIREEGVVMGAIGSAAESDDALCDLARARAADRDAGLVAGVSRRRREVVSTGRPKIGVVDYGAKNHIIESLRKLGAGVTVYPAFTGADTILGDDLDGVVLSNGPGDPTDVPRAVDTVERLIGRLPILGICLGHQITALALGGATYKLKFGHRGANQPVRCHRTRRVFITSQNHGYAVSKEIDRLDGVQITFSNVNDGTVEGFAVPSRNVECVQYHPEASPGPHDTAFVFRRFLGTVKGEENAEA